MSIPATYTVAQYNLALKPFLPLFEVTIADTATALLTLNFADLKNNGVHSINATDGVLALSVARYQALQGVNLSAEDVVTLTDTGQNLADLTPSAIQSLAGKGIDGINASNGNLTLSLAQFEALGSLTLASNDLVTVSATGTSLGALLPSQVADLANKGVDVLNASDNVLTLTLEQLAALGTVTLTGDDTVTLFDTGAAVRSLTPSELTALASKGVDIIDVTGPLTLTVAQALALAATSISFAEGVVVTVSDTSTALADLTAEQLATLAAAGMTFAPTGIDPLILTVAQYRALGASVPTADAGLILEDMGMALASLTVDEMGGLAGNGVTTINALDDALSLSVAQFKGLGAVSLTSADTVTLFDTGAVLGSLTTNVLAGLAGKGIDRLNASDGNLTLSVAQFEALGAVTLSQDDVITLQSSQSYTLPGHVSHLELRDAATTGIGNSLGNFLWGNDANNALFGMSGDDALFGGSGNDQLNGGTGIDWMEGGAGNDTYYVDSAGDKVKETSSGGTADRVYTTVSYTLAANVENLYASGTASISLTGNAASNSIKGNAGSNKINGSFGKDTLYGGAGKDIYVFATKPSSSNVDKIADYRTADDTIQLENAIFTKLKAGKLASSAFWKGSKAHDPSDRIIYDAAKGYLYYDADGTGSSKQVLIATMTKNLKMTNAEFYVI